MGTQNTTLTGMDGKLIWDAAGTNVTIAHLTQWSANIKQEVKDITSMSSTSDAAEYIGGLQDWDCSATAYLKTTGLDITLAAGWGVDAIGEETEIKAELYLDDSGGAGNVAIVYGSCVCSNFNIDQDINGIPTVTYNLIGNGALAWATTDPAL